MKANTFVLAAAVMGAVSLALASVALADDGDKAEHPDHPKLAKYDLVGETQLCVNTTRIRRTEVLDDYAILFHMRGGRIYVNKLSHRCFGLGFEKSFTYTLSTSLLCNVDYIIVLRSFGLGASCGLGSFEELVLKEETPDDSSNATN